METKINWAAIGVAIIAVLCAIYLYFTGPYRLNPPVESIDYALILDEKGNPIPYSTEGKRLPKCDQKSCPRVPKSDIDPADIFDEGVSGFLVLRNETNEAQQKSSGISIPFMNSAQASGPCIIIQLYSTVSGTWEPFVLTPGPNCPPQ